MIYLFYGSDEQKVRTKAFEWVAAARSKEPNLAYARLAREDLTSATLEEAAASGGLFVSRLLVLIDDPFPPTRSSTAEEESEEPNVGRQTSHTSHTSDLIEEHMDTLAASDNAIVILAPKLVVAKAQKFATKAKIEYRFDKSTASEAGRGFNNALVNALAARSRERLWLELNRALRAGDAPERLHGLLHWKARDILEKGARSWTLAEARTLSLSLITLLMDSRRKSLDLAQSLERFVLSF